MVIFGNSGPWCFSLETISSQSRLVHSLSHIITHIINNTHVQCTHGIPTKNTSTHTQTQSHNIKKKNSRRERQNDRFNERVAPRVRLTRQRLNRLSVAIIIIIKKCIYYTYTYTQHTQTHIWYRDRPRNIIATKHIGVSSSMILFAQNKFSAALYGLYNSHICYYTFKLNIQTSPAWWHRKISATNRQDLLSQ